MVCPHHGICPSANLLPCCVYLYFSKAKQKTKKQIICLLPKVGGHVLTLWDSPCLWHSPAPGDRPSGIRTKKYNHHNLTRMTRALSRRGCHWNLPGKLLPESDGPCKRWVPFVICNLRDLPENHGLKGLAETSLFCCGAKFLISSVGIISKICEVGQPTSMGTVSAPHAPPAPTTTADSIPHPQLCALSQFASLCLSV